jgi:O-antigen/teichoic acid export membrane protein
MSRLKRYTHSLISTYALLGANAIYTLVSLPLALLYLSKAEIGLWAITLQVANFFALIDLGMGTSVARILIDHKDDRANGLYGGAIKSGFLVGAAQAAITTVAGMSLVWFMAPAFSVQVELDRPFLVLMIGQIVLSSATFVSRVFAHILYAWQRMDISNYGQIAQLIAGLGALWAGFRFLHFGVMSLLFSAVVSWACALAWNVIMCLRLGFWPRAGEWGRASRAQFRDLFSYGADVFAITIGVQLIMSSQTLLVSRELGTVAAAVWSAMTKTFTLMGQGVWRVIGNAMPALAEMHVRKEVDRMWDRYRSLFLITGGLAMAGGVLLAACNGPFVSFWTRKQFGWEPINDVLLGLWLVLLTQQCCHTSFISALKRIEGLKYAYLVEGLLFVAVSLAVLRYSGFTGMLVCSIVATVVCTWWHGSRRVADLLGTGVKPLIWDWQLPLLKVAGFMIPCWLLSEWALRGSPNWLRFVVNGALLSLIGAWALLRFVLTANLAIEVAAKLPAFMQRPASILAARLHRRRAKEV